MCYALGVLLPTSPQAPPWIPGKGSGYQMDMRLANRPAGSAGCGHAYITLRRIRRSIYDLLRVLYATGRFSSPSPRDGRHLATMTITDDSAIRYVSY